MEKTKAAIITFSKKGAILGKSISEYLQKLHMLEVCAATTNDRATEILPKIDRNLSDWVREKFVSCDLLIFVGACGIAVRHIAPFLVSKKTDPAVLVVDDTGKNVISLLSGHIGGANKWTVRLAEHLGANPVITTSSDCNGKIALDVFAKKNQLVITDFNLAKDTESALLDGEKIIFECETDIEGDIPKEFELINCTESLLYKVDAVEKCERDNDLQNNDNKAIGNQKNNSYIIRVGLHNTSTNALWLIPKSVVVGVGCRRGIDKDQIISGIKKSFDLAGIDIRSILKIVSIDLKKDEIGILDSAKELGVTTEFFSAGELEKIDIISEPSEFVKSVTGVDNVCERAARAGSNMGKVILQKQKFDGVTVALAVMKRSVRFE